MRRNKNSEFPNSQIPKFQASNFYNFVDGVCLRYLCYVDALGLSQAKPSHNINCFFLPLSLLRICFCPMCMLAHRLKSPHNKNLFVITDGWFEGRPEDSHTLMPEVRVIPIAIHRFRERIRSDTQYFLVVLHTAVLPCVCELSLVLVGLEKHSAHRLLLL